MEKSFMLNIGYIKDAYPHSYEAMIAINDEISSLNDEKELEDNFISDETLSEIEKFLESIVNLSESDLEEQFKIKLNLKEQQILENDGTMIDVVFLRDENVNKLIKAFSIIEDFFDTIEGIDLINDYF
jgi:exoribonuclease R